MVAGRVKAGGSVTNRFARFLKVKSGEGNSLGILAGALFAVQAGYWLGGNGVDALITVRLSTDLWPYLLIGKGVMAIFSLALYSYWLNRVNKSVLLTVSTGLIVGLLAFAWFILKFDPPSFFYFFLYILAYTVPDLLVIQVWALAGEVFDSRQSKRLYPLLTVGNIIGIMVGSFLTGPIAGILGGAANLLLAWAAMVAVVYVLMTTLRRRLDAKQRRSARRRDREESRGQTFWSNLRLGYTIVRYYPLMSLLALATCFSALLYWTLWLNNLRVSKEYFKSDPTALAGFFGVASGLAFLLALVIGLFINRLYTKFGVRNFVLSTPTVNLIGYLVIALAFGFWPIVMVRFAQQVSREAVSGSANKTLYNLVPPDARDAAQTFNDGFSNQIGIALAGALMLVAGWLNIPPNLVFFVGVLVAVAYWIVAWRMRALYRSALVQLLREGQQEFFQGGEDESAFGSGRSGDDALQVAINGLVDASEGTRRLSAEVLGKIGDMEGVPHLMKALTTDQSAEVRRTAIIALRQLNTPDAYPSIAEALQDHDPSVRAEAASALRDSPNGIDRISFFFLRKALSDPSPIVRREAILTMTRFGHQGEALHVLWAMGRDKSPQVRREAAFGYGLLADRTMLREVLTLLDDDDPSVRKQAAHSLGFFDSNKSVQALMQSLEDDNQAVREEAASSLARLRHRSGAVLVRYLIETDNLVGQAAALYALSLSKMEENKRQDWHSDSMALLAETYDSPSERLIYSNNGHSTNGVNAAFVLSKFDEQRLLEYGQEQLETARRMREYVYVLKNLDLTRPSRRSRLRRDPANLSLLLKSLEERYEKAVSRLIRVVGLLGNVEAINLAATGLQSKDRNASRNRADAIETLENFGDVRLTPGLIQLLEVDDQNLAISSARTLIETLVEIWLEGDPWLRACVLHVAGLFDLQRLRSLVEQVLLLEQDPEAWVYEAAMDAQQRLDYPRDDEAEAKLLEQLSVWEKDMQTLGTLSTMSRILFLQKVPLFANLSPEDLRRIALVSKERLFAPGEIICYEGDEGDELYIVVSGKVQIITGYGGANPSGVGGGSGRTLDIASEGRVLGEMAVFDDIPRSATMRAYNGAVRLLTLSGDEFKRILRERPELAVEVIRLLSRSLRETNRRVQDAPTLAASTSFDNSSLS